MHVSIIIPVFNRAHLVARAIDSALEQTIPCEVLLVDHGSTDGIQSVVETYGERIRYVHRDQDNGPIACWKDGIEQASGDFVHFTYDDDWIRPTFVERCLDQFNDDVAFVYTRATLHDGNLVPIREILRHPPGINPIVDVVQYLLASPLSISPGCAVFRRKDMLKNLLTEIPGATGPYGKNSGVGEDLLLFLLTSLDYKRYAHVPDSLADFLAHSGSITINAQQTGSDGALADSYRVAKQFYASHKGACEPMIGWRKFMFVLRWQFRSLFFMSIFRR